MLSLWQDVRFAARLLRKAPGFSTIVLTTVAVGIAANTTILSVADALFWQRLPVANADRIVNIDQHRAGREEGFPLSLPDYEYYRAQSRSFDELAAHYPTSPIHLVIHGEPTAAFAGVVTANYFDVLGLRPRAGRFFRADEDVVRGRDAVAVISDALWQRQFSRDPAALGSTIHINGTAFTIVGVAPPGFGGVLSRMPVTQVWIPSAMFNVGYRYCDTSARDCRIVWMLGRLKAGVSQNQAQAELGLLAQQLESAYPATNRGLTANVMAARGMSYPGEQGVVVRLLLAAVAILLAVACANLAGLSIARSLGRRKEIAARLALGASRRRVVRQLLTESVFLALIGGALGMLLAFWTIDIVRQFFATDYAGNPVNVDVRVSATALLSTFGLSIVTGVTFGLIPAIRAGGSDPMMAIRDEAAATGAPRTGLQRVLVAAQVALSLILLVGASLVVRSLFHLYRGQGFDPSHVLVVRLRPSLVDYSFDKGRAYQADVIRRLEALPGVVSASPSVHFPVFNWGARVGVWRPGDAPARSEDAQQTVFDQVGPRYFETLGMRLVEGREFDATDRLGAPAAAIVNDVLARQLWPARRASGQPIVVDGREHVVVGVVADGQYVGSAGARPYLYLNYWQSGDADNFAMDSRTHIRVEGDPAAMMASIRQALIAVDPAVPVSEYAPLSQRVGLEFQPVRVASTMFLCFGAVALFLSAIGIYGVLAFTARQRTREIAIRLALGARRSTVMGQVLGEGTILAGTGTALGLLVALAGSRLLESLLYGVSRHDLTAFIAAPMLLFGIALAASYWPARAAARVDPATALRAE